MTTLRPIVRPTRAARATLPAGRHRDDRVAARSSRQHLHAPLRAVEDLRAAPRQAHTLLERGQGLLEAEAAGLELLHHLAQPLQHPVEAAALVGSGGHARL